MVSETLLTSFKTSYLVLMGYTGITLVEALRTNNLNSRHIMNIETTVSIVAGLVYYMFLKKLKKDDVDLHEITKLRYIDWAITTPLIILVMMLFYSSGSPPAWSTYAILVILNYGMLLSGYLGEIKQIPKEKGLVIGFICLALMLIALIIMCVPRNSHHAALYFFGLIWSGYGIAYLLNDEQKNLTYNVLDVISKALFGIVLYFYYGKVLKF